MDPAQLDRIQRFFATHDAGREAEHMALVDPDVSYYGSVFGREARGQAAYLGIFRSVHRDLGIARRRPVKVFGQWPEVAVLVEFHWAPPREGFVEAVVRLGFTPEGRIRLIQVLWDPRGAIQL